MVAKCAEMEINYYAFGRIHPVQTVQPFLPGILHTANELGEFFSRISYQELFSQNFRDTVVNLVLIRLSIRFWTYNSCMTFSKSDRLISVFFDIHKGS